MGTTVTPATTTPWKENAPTTRPTTMFPSRMVELRPETNFPFMQHHAHLEGQQVQTCAWHPLTKPSSAPRRSKLTGKQATTAVQPNTPPRHEPTLEMERVLMVDYASTQAQDKELAHPANRAEAQADASMVKSPSASPSLTTDGLDRMCHQLAEIHTITATQLEECTHWRRVDSTPLSAQVGASRLRSGVAPLLVLIKH
jgi:hypothetical protein